MSYVDYHILKPDADSLAAEQKKTSYKLYYDNDGDWLYYPPSGEDPPEVRIDSSKVWVGSNEPDSWEYMLVTRYKYNGPATSDDSCFMGARKISKYTYPEGQWELKQVTENTFNCIVPEYYEVAKSEQYLNTGDLEEVTKRS